MAVMYFTQSTADACDLKMSWLSSGILNTLQVWSCPTVTALSCKRIAGSVQLDNDAQKSQDLVGHALSVPGSQRVCSSSAEGPHAEQSNLMPDGSAGWS